MKTGDEAPHFTLPSSNGKNLSLEDFRGKWVVLYFYPKDSTPGCTLEAREFTQLKSEFEKNNAVILGVSPDSVRSHCNFREKQGLEITLLSDSAHKVLEAYGAWHLKKMYGREYYGVIRSTVLIDPRGKIAHRWTGVRARGHAMEVLNILQEKCGR